MELGPNDVDRFSALPEHLLLHIISFLPMEDSVPTVRLSNTLKNLWKKNTTLDFSQAWSKKPHNDYIQSITAIYPMLEIEKIMKFRVKFYYERGDKEEVDQWIEFSVQKKVQQLKFVNQAFEWDDEENEVYQLPHNVFQNEFLTDLHLRGCELNLPTNIQLNALKTLHLNRMFFESDLVNKIINGCPFLESVVLKTCNYWKDLNVFIENPNVKRLVIATKSSIELDENNLVLYAPHIQFISFLGPVRKKEYQLINISSVTHARFCFEFHLEEVMNYGLVIMLRRIIEKFANVETLQLCSLCIQVLLDGDANRSSDSSSSELSSPENTELTQLSQEELSSPENTELTQLSQEELWRRDCSLDISFGRLTFLDINTGFSKWESYRVVRLLRASPNLETLILHIGKKIELNEHSEYLEELDTNMIGVVDDEIWYVPYPLQHLKTVTIYGFMGGNDTDVPDPSGLIEDYLENKKNEFNMVRVLLEEAIILEKMTISVTEISEELNHITRNTVRKYKKSSEGAQIVYKDGTRTWTLTNYHSSSNKRKF